MAPLRPVSAVRPTWAQFRNLLFVHRALIRLERPPSALSIPGHPGKWSLTVTRNYRLTLVVDKDAQTVGVLDYEDYR
jgi:hypothetical protein